MSPSHFADPDAASVLPPKLPKGGAVLSSSRYRASAAIRTAPGAGRALRSGFEANFFASHLHGASVCTLPRRIAWVRARADIGDTTG